MKPLRVEYDITQEDYESLIQVIHERDVYARQAWRKVKRMFAAYLALLIGLQVLLFVLTDRTYPVALIATAAFVGWAAWLWPDRGRFRRLARKQVGMQLRTPAGRAFLGKRVAEVGPDGITVQSNFGVTNLKWTAVFDVVATPDHLFLVLVGPAYLPVPRSAFEFDDDFHRFCDAVAELAAHKGSVERAE